MVKGNLGQITRHGLSSKDWCWLEEGRFLSTMPIETLDERESPRLLKSHLPYNLLPSSIHDQGCKASTTINTWIILASIWVMCDILYNVQAMTHYLDHLRLSWPKRRNGFPVSPLQERAGSAKFLPARVAGCVCRGLHGEQGHLRPLFRQHC